MTEKTKEITKEIIERLTGLMPNKITSDLLYECGRLDAIDRIDIYVGFRDIQTELKIDKNPFLPVWRNRYEDGWYAGKCETNK